MCNLHKPLIIYSMSRLKVTHLGYAGAPLFLIQSVQCVFLSQWNISLAVGAKARLTANISAVCLLSNFTNPGIITKQITT